MSDSAARTCFASHLSTRSDATEAIAESLAHVKAQLQGSADLVTMFVSADFSDAVEQIAARICDELGTENLIGCSGESIVGMGKEIEAASALSLWAARLPNVSVTPMHLNFDRTPDGGIITGWPDQYESEWPAGSVLLTLGDPFTFPADLLVERLNEDRPGVRVIGGMASAASRPGDNRLILGRQVFREGAVVAMLQGDVRVRTIVSQGCRPIGRPMVVTKSERNIIHELGGKPPLLQLKEVFDTLPTREQQLVQSALHVGRVVSEYREQFEPGDFLIRNVIGHDPDSGAVAIGDFIRPGQTVQFHIRDAETADKDLRQMLSQTQNTNVGTKAVGGLLFTCNGRGSRLFHKPHHDAECIRQALGEIPLAGFFAAGELGPVGNQNFMHGLTASIAVFDGTGEA